MDRPIFPKRDSHHPYSPTLGLGSENPSQNQKAESKVKTDSRKFPVVLVFFQGTSLGQGIQSDGPTWSGFDFGFPSLRCTDWDMCGQEG